MGTTPTTTAPTTGAPTDNGASATTETIVASATVASQCATPRTGINPSTGTPFTDVQGTTATEKRWVRGWIDETYLWYDEVPTTLLSTNYATPVAYFNVLKTPKLTASGRAKDRFHFTEDTARYVGLAQNGVGVGYGAEFAYISAAPPRDIRVAFTDPGTPAAQGGLLRGDRVIEVDGVDVTAGADVATLNAGLAPTVEGQAHDFKLRSSAGVDRSVTLTSARLASAPVQNVKTLETGSGRVGYMLFNDHLAQAESQLVAAINQLKGANIADLVIDMRYNGGGYLDIASELAFMVSSSAVTTGKVFERLTTNGKNPFNMTLAQSVVPFRTTTQGFSSPAGQPLPQLGLSKVTLLVGPDTCSASESVINSLRGVGVTVNLVGGTTCGKPYGFYPQDNCGTTYFAIQFQGVNQLGFGDYGDGFAPTCAVADDFGHALGDVAEARLAAALSLRAGGSCPAAGAAKGATANLKAEAEGQPYLLRPPTRENRLLSSQPGI